MKPITTEDSTQEAAKVNDVQRCSHHCRPNLPVDVQGQDCCTGGGREACHRQGPSPVNGVSLQSDLPSNVQGQDCSAGGEREASCVASCVESSHHR